MFYLSCLINKLHAACYDYYSIVSYSSDIGGGDWNTSGCTTVVNGDIVTCSCNHLTHFAILLSPGIEV